MDFKSNQRIRLIIRSLIFLQVETIGDAYMVVSGLPIRTENNIVSIVNLALELRHFVTHHQIANHPDKHMRIRIGIHTGQCAAGRICKLMNLIYYVLDESLIRHLNISYFL